MPLPIISHTTRQSQLCVSPVVFKHISLTNIVLVQFNFNPRKIPNKLFFYLAGFGKEVFSKLKSG